MAHPKAEKPATEPVGGLHALSRSPQIERDATENSARLQRLAKRLYSLGERPLFEFLREIISGADPLTRLEIYAALDPQSIRMLGGDVLPIDDALAVIDGGRK